jgi:hypothetical protein
LTAADGTTTMWGMHPTHPGVLCRYVDYRRTSSALCR